ncbi:MAG TPA: hypothetical protein H9976_02550 [Candidatus Akkermansia intestinavium]|nr:hypothetical protein [Candidatus Akkermansia intestinavium]
MKPSLLSLSFIVCGITAAQAAPSATSLLTPPTEQAAKAGATGKSAPAETSGSSDASGSEAATQAAASADGSAAAETPAAQPGQNPQAQAPQTQPEEESLVSRLRRLTEDVDARMATLKKPSRMLSSSHRRFKERAERDLKEIMETSGEVRDLNEKYSNTLTGPFEFTVSAADRDKYVRDAQAAYQAMLTDMKENKGKRKVGGLDKFELLRDRYQGIPEYKEAFDTYLKTLKQLDNHWSKMYERETKRRERMNDKRQRTLEEADEEQYEKLAERFAKDKENIETIWYNPSPKNLKMLRNCTNKVKDALRRNKDVKLEPEVGKVPEMLAAFWSKMDEAREALIQGDFDRAGALLETDEVARGVTRLRNEIFPREYREPLTEQLRVMQREVTTRERNRNREKLALERKMTDLDRKVRSYEARVDSMMASIEAELAQQIDEDVADEGEADGEKAEGATSDDEGAADTEKADDAKDEAPDAEGHGEQPAKEGADADKPAADEA